MFALTVFVGVVCGVAAVSFHLCIKALEQVLINRALEAPSRWWIALTILVPTLGGAACGILLYRFAPDARGSGIPQVKVAYAVQGGRIPFRVAIGKFFIGALQIGSGASLGREGPTVQICAGIVSFFGQAAALSRQNLRRLLPVGAAAGIAAAFNAPVAAVTFVVEEIIGDLDDTMLSGVVVAAALAAVTERGILGEHPIFDVPAGYGLHDPYSLLFYAVLGVGAAVVSIAFTDSLLWVRGSFQKLKAVPVWLHPAVGGAVTGALAVVGILAFSAKGVVGGGYEALSSALAGKLTVAALAGLCLLKLVATVASYGSGGAGGIFAPSLFLGGMLGGVVGWLDVAAFGHSTSEIGAFALVGMGAVFAGIIRAPITSVLIIFEMTDGYSLVLPLMIANMVAYGLARRWRPTPLYDALLEQDNIVLPHRGGAVSRALEFIQVRSAMTSASTHLTVAMTARDAAKEMSKTSANVFPVVDDERAFVGVVTKAQLQRTIADGNGDQSIEALADARPFAHPDYSLLRAVLRMDQIETAHLVVIERRHRHVVGVISMSDVIHAQARAAEEAGLSDLSIAPTGG